MFMPFNFAVWCASAMVMLLLTLMDKKHANLSCAVAYRTAALITDVQFFAAVVGLNRVGVALEQHLPFFLSYGVWVVIFLFLLISMIKCVYDVCMLIGRLWDCVVAIVTRADRLIPACYFCVLAYVAFLG